MYIIKQHIDAVPALIQSKMWKKSKPVNNFLLLLDQTPHTSALLLNHQLVATDESHSIKYKGAK